MKTNYFHATLSGLNKKGNSRKHNTGLAGFLLMEFQIHHPIAMTPVSLPLRVGKLESLLSCDVPDSLQESGPSPMNTVKSFTFAN